ncbi:MAG: alpha/beta fold hydrolase, partial [Candidatus Nanohaloarchaea archaeon]|nr:alpha/beta fold hydrolase [Candidatus Nanohaloarchaea archaeon]
TPVSMQPLASDIRTVTGFETIIPPLAGHNTSPRDLLHVEWEDWYATAENMVGRLQEGYNNVIVVGHSLGALLGVEAALDQNLSGLVLLAPSFGFRLEGVPGFTTLIERGLVSLPVLPWHNRIAAFTHTHEQAGAPEGYHWFPTSALRELLRLRNHVTDRLASERLDLPSLVLQAADDMFADPAATKRYADKMGSSLRIYRKGGHLLPLSQDRQEFVDDVTWFLMHC